MDAADIRKTRETFSVRFSKNVPIIAILRGVKPSQAPATAEALVEAGINVIEVPLTSGDALTSIEKIRIAMGAQIWLGAGTVIDPNAVVDCQRAGAEFIVSPDCNVDVIRKTVALNLTSLPGVLTPTEVFTALRAGATALKLFPAGIIGPSGIRALTAVLPSGVTLIPVGGIEPDTLADYWNAGIRVFAAGSYIYRPDFSPETVKSRAESLITALRALTSAR